MLLGIWQVRKFKKQWIVNKIKEYEMSCEEKKKSLAVQTVKVLGRSYVVEVQYKMGKTPSLSFVQNRIQVMLPYALKKVEITELISTLMDKMYEKIAEKEVERAMEKTRLLLEIAPEDYEIKKIEGSIAKCKEGKITINPAIVMYEREIIDYIVLHEFCHLKYRNHTKSFYQMLRTYMPNYEEKAKKLNKIAY